MVNVSDSDANRLANVGLRYPKIQNSTKSPFQKPLFIILTNNNNNNDRLTAFDPGQPG